MLRNLFCSALLACAAATSHASTLLSDFETSADGWTPSGFTSTLETDGGPDGTGDGYLRVRDSTGSFGTITNTTKFAGDLSGFYAATLSFDYAQFIPASGTSYLGGFGTVTLSGAGGTVSADIVAGNPTPTWQNTAVAFDEVTFGTSLATFQSIIGNLSSFTIEVESWNGIDEFVGIDNIKLQGDMPPPVPLPAGAVLLMTGLAALGWARRRAS